MNKKEKVKTLLRAVAYAFESFSNHFQKGRTSGELFGVFFDALREKLGEFEILYDYIWGNDSLKIEGITDPNYIPKDGDSVIFDISISQDDCYCDVCRTFFVGRVSEEQMHMFELVKQSILAGEKKLRNGAAVADIYKAVNSVYEKKGMKLVHHAGHQIDENPVSEPIFVLDNPGKIESNHIYTIESGCYEKFGIRLENDYFVGDGHIENLLEALINLNIEEYQL